MNRLLVVFCPELLDEDESGASHRSFAEVTEAVETYCPWVTTVSLGICSLPARGPSRYFGGEHALGRRIAETVGAITTVEVGVADGLFAAVLAARQGLIVPAGGTADFLAPFPVAVLGHPELAELLHRLGVRTVGDFAALPESHVLGRFGGDGIRCHRVACGQSGELDDPGSTPAGARGVSRARDISRARDAGQAGFWGGASDADVRAGQALASVQDLLGPDSVVIARTQGGRGPAQRARFVTWNAQVGRVDPVSCAPWPGQIPPPAPVLVHPDPQPVELVDEDGGSVTVSGRGLLTTTPGRLSVEKGPWSAVTMWAGPWPSDERWWSRTRRRNARLQVVTGIAAYLLMAERGRWWVEATYG